jgi:putative transposase
VGDFEKKNPKASNCNALRFRETINKKGGSYCKTSNIIKSEKQLLKLNQRLTGIRHNHVHQTTSEIVKTKPSFIVLEDLNVSGMMKNKHLSKAVQEQCLAEFARQIEYKCNWNGIEYIEVHRYFPSSKTCSCCGNIKSNLKLSDRTYICEECGLVVDRDLNAAINLKKYGELLTA